MVVGVDLKQLGARSGCCLLHGLGGSEPVLLLKSLVVGNMLYAEALARERKSLETSSLTRG